MAEDTTAIPTAEPLNIPSWRDDLPDDLKTNESLATITDVSALARSFVDTKSLVGANTIKIPARDADEDQMGVFYDKLGRPAKSDDYEIPSEGLPEGHMMSDEDRTKLKATFHKLGLTPVQAAMAYRELAQSGFDAGQSLTQQSEQVAAANVEALKKQWGSAYDQNVDLAKSAVLKLGGEAFRDKLNAAGLGTDPVVLDALTKVGKMWADDAIVGVGPKNYELSPAAATEAWSKKQSDSEFVDAWLNAGHPNHKAASAEAERLFRMMNPEEDGKDGT